MNWMFLRLLKVKNPVLFISRHVFVFYEIHTVYDRHLMKSYQSRIKSFFFHKLCYSWPSGSLLLLFYQVKSQWENLKSCSHIEGCVAETYNLDFICFIMSWPYIKAFKHEQGLGFTFWWVWMEKMFLINIRAEMCECISFSDDDCDILLCPPATFSPLYHPVTSRLMYSARNLQAVIYSCYL